jgi:hypothetical protein
LYRIGFSFASFLVTRNSEYFFKRDKWVVKIDIFAKYQKAYTGIQFYVHPKIRRYNFKVSVINKLVAVRLHPNSKREPDTIASF